MSVVLLNEDDPQIIQPKQLKIELMNHQKTIVKRMLDIEENGEIKINNTTDIWSSLKKTYGSKGTICTNVGILGDKVGAGKTYDIVALLSHRPYLNRREIILGGNKNITLKLEHSVKNHININLLIVPSKILPQWKSSFDYARNLRVYSISTNKEIDNIIKTTKKKKINYYDEEIEEECQILDDMKLENISCILMGDTMFKRFCDYCEDVVWNRVIIDEADTIKLPRNGEYIYYNFMWLITGTPSGLKYSCKPIFSGIFKDNNYNLFDSLVIKNDENYIGSSIKLPHPKRLIIKCLTPKEINLIKDLIPPSVLQMINAGNSDEAIKVLNFNIDTNDNIFQVITKNIIEKINNYKIELDAENKKYYIDLLEKERKINLINNNILKLEDKYNCLKKRIYELNNDYCPVCLDSFNKPVIVKCCNNCFCFDCLAVSLGSLHNNKCPYCRSLISQNDVLMIDNNIEQIKKNIEKNNKEEKEKMDVLIDLIKGKPDGSFIVFANYADTFYKIETKFKEEGISYVILKGLATTIKKSVDDFRDKKIRVLMLNAQYFGAGMNLQMTTDLVIFHRFDRNMEEQIIGRAQRFGRTCPLNVYYLLHDNEGKEIEDNFKFEDIKDVHYSDWLLQQKDIELKEDNSKIKNEVKELKINKLIQETEILDMNDFDILE